MSRKSARRYYRVGPAIWNEPWDDDTRLAAFYILTCEHRTLEGIFRLPLAYAASDLGWSAKRFGRAFDRLRADGFVEYDPDTSVCLIVNALRWQAPENPNQVKAAVRKIVELPASPLLNRFRGLAATHSDKLAEALAERFGQPFGEPLTQGLQEGLGEPPSPPPSHNSSSGRGINVEGRPPAATIEGVRS